MSHRKGRPLVFLAGPPGAGKSAAGGRAAGRLGLSFLDLSPAPHGDVDPGDAEGGRRAFAAAVGQRGADVVALSWRLQQDRQAWKAARRHGTVVLLWAHPLEMEARSPRTGRVLTPVARRKTRGGFGREGTGCREFRSLDRACHECLLLRGMSLGEVVDALAEEITAIREEVRLSPAQREGLDGWADEWRDDYDAAPRAARALADAMARYTLHLRKQGASARVLAGVYADLQAAGMLVMSHGVPRVHDVLSRFLEVPYEHEYGRTFSDSPHALARYRRTLRGFRDFLVREGPVPEP